LGEHECRTDVVLDDIDVVLTLISILALLSN